MAPDSGAQASRTERHGTVALVTGGSQGIGRAVAELLAAHGASMAVSGLEADRVEETVRRYADAPGVRPTFQRRKPRCRGRRCRGLLAGLAVVLPD